MSHTAAQLVLVGIVLLTTAISIRSNIKRVRQMVPAGQPVPTSLKVAFGAYGFVIVIAIAYIGVLLLG